MKTENEILELALTVYPKDEFYIGSPGVLFDQKARDRNKWIEGYRVGVQELKSVNDALLNAAKMVLDDWHSKSSNFDKKEPAYLKAIREAIKNASL